MRDITAVRAAVAESGTEYRQAGEVHSERAGPAVRVTCCFVIKFFFSLARVFYSFGEINYISKLVLIFSTALASPLFPFRRVSLLS